MLLLYHKKYGEVCLITDPDFCVLAVAIRDTILWSLKDLNVEEVD